VLILASSSPRRREILANAGVPFQVCPVEVAERVLPGETPGRHVRRLARLKAEAAPRAPGEIVLAADTVVVADGRILGKPRDAAEARRMLRLLAGRWHRVVTGFCLVSDRGTVAGAETTRVRLLPMSRDDIARYAASGEPMDKAGAYAIQGLASKFVDRIEGCYFNVVGLPVARVMQHYRRLLS
jgi:septum formation protein